MTAKSQKQKASVVEIVTSQIIEIIEKSGKLPWNQPWSSSITEPRNVRGTGYSGINVFLLRFAAVYRGYKRPLWLTFNQAEAMGGYVRKGEHGVMIFFKATKKVTPKQDTKPKDPAGETPDEEDEEKTYKVLKYFLVFNVEQCGGLPAHLITVPEAATAPSIPENPAIEAFVAKTNAKFIVDDRAYYAPALDLIGLPPREAFKTPVGFEGARFHELGHWTGHESRLARIESSSFGDHAYSIEELVAELIAAALCAEFGLEKVAINNSAAYIQHWLGVLKAHPQFLLTAGRQVDKALACLKGQPISVSGE